MAKYKTLPNYQLIRPNINVQFDSQGIYETLDEEKIKYLDGCAPFIERLDKNEAKPEEKPAPKSLAKPSKTK